MGEYALFRGTRVSIPGAFLELRSPRGATTPGFFSSARDACDACVFPARPFHFPPGPSKVRRVPSKVVYSYTAANISPRPSSRTLGARRSLSSSRTRSRSRAFVPPPTRVPPHASFLHPFAPSASPPSPVPFISGGSPRAVRRLTPSRRQARRARPPSSRPSSPCVPPSRRTLPCA